MTIFVQKRQPSELTTDDLEQIATYIERNYVIPPLKNFLTVAFTSNAWFSQPSFNDQQRIEYGNRHLRQWQDASMPLSGKLTPGRVARAQLPLLQGDDAINFFSNGNSGIPINGIELLALQFFPMACARCGIGLLAVQSDNEDLTFELAREFLMQNLQAVVQAQAAGEAKLPRAARSLKTLLIETLLKVEYERSFEDKPTALTAYNFTNGKSPDVRIYYLPFEIMRFLQLAQTATYEQEWHRLVQRSWYRSKAKEEQESRTNTFYEDLFTLPQEAARFVRRYFLRLPRADGELELVRWSFIELFLKEVLRMEATRLSHIRSIGDNLAAYIQTEGGKKIFRAFCIEKKPSSFRTRLINANLANIRNGKPPVCDMDTYYEVFEESEDEVRSDWWLARDLVVMRMIDSLATWLQSNRDAVEEVEEEVEVEMEEAALT